MKDTIEKIIDPENYPQPGVIKSWAGEPLNPM
jgi:hypothetical protein